MIRTQSEKEESFRSKYEGLKQEEFEWWTMEPIIELPEGCSAAGKECKVDANQLTGENGKLKEAEWKEIAAAKAPEWKKICVKQAADKTVCEGEEIWWAKAQVELARIKSRVIYRAAWEKCVQEDSEGAKCIACDGKGLKFNNALCGQDLNSKSMKCSGVVYGASLVEQKRECANVRGSNLQKTNVENFKLNEETKKACCCETKGVCGLYAVNGAQYCGGHMNPLVNDCQVDDTDPACMACHDKCKNDCSAVGADGKKSKPCKKCLKAQGCGALAGCSPKCAPKQNQCEEVKC